MSNSYVRMSFIAVSLLVLASCATPGGAGKEAGEPTPNAAVPAGPDPSQLLAERKLNLPPPLAKAADVKKFVEWAGFSAVEERETARRTIAAASDNKEVVKAIIDEIELAKDVKAGDNSRALLLLSILGEMKSPHAQDYLVKFANRELPKEGTVVDGEILERTAQAMLQGKAVDGIAYLRNQEAEAAVLAIVAEHPSIIVRAEAIRAYLWNHDDEQNARKTLLRYVRKGEEIYLDRVSRLPGDDAETFNRKLEVYLKAHPEAVPPGLEKVELPVDQRNYHLDTDPPKF
jgi:hypothetical protein